MSIQARRGNGAMVLVGWAMEQTRDVICDTENANLLRYCDQTGELYQELGAVSRIPFRHEFKLAASHPLPWGLQAAAAFLSYPGATSNSPGSATAPVGGWAGPLNVLWNVPPNLFPGGRTEVVTAALIPPGMKYLKRWNQLDITLKRVIRVRRFELQPAIEVYNLLNSSVVLNEIQTFGPTLGVPTQTMQGRFVKLGGLMKF